MSKQQTVEMKNLQRFRAGLVSCLAASPLNFAYGVKPPAFVLQCEPACLQAGYKRTHIQKLITELSGDVFYRHI